MTGRFNDGALGLSVMQINEACRQIIDGIVGIVMLLVYGRGTKVQG